MTTSDPASSGPRRGPAAVVLGSVVLMLLVVAAASSLDEALWTAPETTTSEPVVEESPSEEVDASPQPRSESGSRLPDAGTELGVIAALLLLAVIVLAVATIPRGDAGWSWASVSRRRRRRLPSTPLPDMPRVVEPDDAAVRAALRDGPPRNAIVRCWMLLEEDAAAAGIRRADSETSSEYVERVIGASSVDPQPIADLGALFREARFSSRPVDETHRARAEEALTQTLAGLGERMEQRS